MSVPPAAAPRRRTPARRDGVDAQIARVLAEATARAGPADLPWLVAGYESAQVERVALGEQLRAVLQGRARAAAPPAGSLPEPVPAADADAWLARVRSGEAAGPVPALATLYRRLWDEERAMGAAMERTVTAHPAWPWLEQVRGVGRTLSARLLARLDVRRAGYASSFWRYCGLSTVAVGGDGVRRAAPRAGRGERRAYDPRARSLCHLIGVSILRRGGAYKAYYRDVRAQLDEAHPDWPAGRRYLAALRRMEKRFLAHLWLVWREREGLPVGAPHVDAPSGPCAPSPWSMTG